MPQVFDKVDILLLKALMEDGRRSYRQLAKIANVSTPTAQVRIKRMFNSGFIKRIGPIFDLERVQKSVSAILYLKVDSAIMNKFVAHLSSLEYIKSVFLATGEWNVIARVTCSDADDLQSIIDTKISSNPGVKLINSQVVTRTIKDEQGFTLSPDIRIQLHCDYCGGEISGTLFKLKVGEGERYLCCKGCLNSYKEKFGTRIAKLEKALVAD